MGTYMPRNVPTAQEIQAAIVRAEAHTLWSEGNDEAWAFAAALKWVVGEGIWSDYIGLVTDQERSE